jgi:hypothetical protein
MIKKSVLLALSIAILASGCGNMSGTPRNTDENRTNRLGALNGQQGPTILNNQGQELGEGQQYQVVVNGQQTEEITSYTQNGQVYIPLEQVLRYLDFNVKQEENRILAGFTDAFIELQINSNKATVEEENRTLPSPIVTLEGEPFITTTSLERVLGEGTQVTTEGNTLTIQTEEEDEGNGIFPENNEMENFDFQRTDGEEVPAVSSSK